MSPKVSGSWGHTRLLLENIRCDVVYAVADVLFGDLGAVAGPDVDLDSGFVQAVRVLLGERAVGDIEVDPVPDEHVEVLILPIEREKLNGLIGQHLSDVQHILKRESDEDYPVEIVLRFYDVDDLPKVFHRKLGLLDLENADLAVVLAYADVFVKRRNAQIPALSAVLILHDDRAERVEIRLGDVCSGADSVVVVKDVLAVRRAVNVGFDSVVAFSVCGGDECGAGVLLLDSGKSAVRDQANASFVYFNCVSHGKTSFHI